MNSSTSNLSNSKLLRYIGEITIVFCELEDVIDSGIAIELNDRCHDIGYLATCRMNFQQKLALYERLLTYRLHCCELKEQIPTFEKFMKEILGIQNFRNHIMHGIRFNEKRELFLKKNFQVKLISYNDSMGETDTPYKGWNAQFPKYQKYALTEHVLKDQLKKMRGIIERMDEWNETF